MIRNIKAMGLAFFALVALGAVLASSASAQFEAGAAPATLTISSNAMQKFVPVAGGAAIECTTMTLDSSEMKALKQVELEVFPTYSNCEKIIGLNVEVKMNGCGYLFHVAANSTTGTVDVKCPAGAKIEISIGGGFCLYTISEEAANTGLKHVEFKNIGAGAGREIVAEPTVAGINSVRTKNGLGCPGAGAAGTYSGNSTITGENGGGMVGVFMD